jgi:CheY-like chemotaxis protein
VQDTGVGIRDEDLHTLFDSFSQLDTRKNRNIEGTGLGLAISRNLVELMGGEINVESKYGEGSSFSFSIIQKVENPKPMPMLSNKNERRVAVWKNNETNARVVANKIKKLGIPCDIIDSSGSISGYTHVFFDYSQLDEVLKTPCENTRLYASARSLVDNERIPHNMSIVQMPLTSNLLTQFLDGKVDGNLVDDTNISGYALKLHNTRLLVVDDIDINLIITKSVLLTFGGEIDTVESGLKAIEMVQEKDYDLVFMDHMMPEVDGVDATKAIRALTDSKYQKLPIVALTANVVGDVRDMFLKSGMNDYLSKPIERNEIERVLQEWLPKEKWSNTRCDEK